MQIREIASELKLPYIKDNYQELIDGATHTSMDYLEFLKRFLEEELSLRKENGINRRLRYAKFPIKMYLEDFDRNKYGPEFKKKFEELETLKFIENKENVILIRTPEAGKSHYSIGLGIKACWERKHTLITIRISFS